MNDRAPPRIFSSRRRLAARCRAAALQRRIGAATTLAREMALDVADRLSFLREPFADALLIGDWTGALARKLAAQGTRVTGADPSAHLGDVAIDEVAPLPGAPHGLIVSLGLLDTINDLPGALALMRRALAPGGMMIASFPGAGSLPVLRAAMLAADDTRPGPRIHPQVDVRAAGQLMNRLGFANPVVDGWGFEVAYDSLDQLVVDLRAQAHGNVLADPAPPLSRAALARARAAFSERAGADGRVRERYEIVTLTGSSPA